VPLGVAAAAASSHPHLDELIAAARSRQLAADPTWLALLHFEPTLWRPTPASLADSPDFFLAPDGHRDAGAELEATLRAFFAPAGETARGREHPQCVFRARYRWLERQLGFDAARLPPRPCPEFEAWRDAIAPESLTLVFPEAYMNNPSSMFGHTLLRFDASHGGERRDLLAYAANFSANPGDDNAVVFAWRGILGEYPGRFNLEPYYQKVAEYADWEQRDLWEYELALSQAEIDFVLEHLWELRGVVFDYYFFDENCSYQLLGLLRVARPDLVYWQRFQVWAAPSDTVRAVVRDAGLLRGVTFRPSATTALRHEMALLSRSSRRLAMAIAEGRVAPTDPVLDGLDDDERALVLTVAHDTLRHSFLAHGVERQPAAERARRILLALSRVPHRSDLVPRVPAPAVRPDEGHGTARLSAGAGWRRDRPFVQAQFRPTFHDLLDPQGGYTAGAQIDFLALALRVYGDDGEVRLQDFTLVDIVSLAPRDDLFQPISWRIGTRVLSLLVPGDGPDSGIPGLVDRYAWRTKGAAGLAYELPWRLLGYGFLQGDADVSGALRNGISIGGGAEVGVYRGFGDDRLRAHLFSEVVEFALGQQHTAARWGLAQRLTVGRDTALRLEIAANRDYGQTWVEGSAQLQWYF
jgi:hypothetical protein